MLRLLLLTAILGMSTAFVQFTNGNSGPICDVTTGRRCPSPSRCSGTTCQCPPGQHGPVGGLACEDAGSTVWSASTNDPALLSSNHSELNRVPVPCQSDFLKLRTKLHAPSRPNAKCELEIESGILRGHGKFFFGGALIILKTTGLPSDRHIQIQVFGYKENAPNGRYKFTVKFRLPETADKSWRDHMTGPDFAQYGNVLAQVRNNDNTFNLRLNKCGVRIVFRPADTSVGQYQRYMPGFVLFVDNDHDPQYLHTDTSLSADPVTPLSTAVAGRSGEDEAIYRAFVSAALIPHFPTISPKCSFVKVALLTTCSVKGHQRTTDALKECGFILKKEHFVRCVSRDAGVHSSNRVLQLYALCLNAACDRDSKSCSPAYNEFFSLHEKCKAHIPSNFLMSSCGP